MTDDRMDQAAPEPGTEFSVVWRWRTDPFRDEFSDERRKVYKTEAGARRLLAKLTSNGGKYEKHTEVEPTYYEDGLIVEHWRLDYAHLETRQVGPWIAPFQEPEEHPE